MARGNIAKRSAEPPGNTAGFTNVVTAFDPHFDHLAVDVVLAGGNSADLCTIPLVLAAPHVVQIWSSYACQLNPGTSVAIVFVEIDGVSVVSGVVSLSVVDFEVGAANWQANLAAGAHTIKLRATCLAGGFFCQALTDPTSAYANLTANVLNI